MTAAELLACERAAESGEPMPPSSGVGEPLMGMRDYDRLLAERGPAHAHPLHASVGNTRVNAAALHETSRVLRAASPDGELFPTRLEITAQPGGYAALRVMLATGGGETWANHLDLSLRLTQLPMAARRARCEEIIRSCSPDGRTFPTTAQLKTHPEGATVHNHVEHAGGASAWAARLGMLTTHEAAAIERDARVERVVRACSPDGRTFPTQAQLKAHPEGGAVLAAILRSGGASAWAAKLGMEARAFTRFRRRGSGPDALLDALMEFMGDRDDFPAVREFQEAGLAGLDAMLRRTGGRAHWLEKVNEARRSTR